MQAEASHLKQWAKMRISLWAWDSLEDHDVEAEKLYLSQNPDRAHVPWRYVLLARHAAKAVGQDRASQPHRFSRQRAALDVLRDVRRLDRRITGPDAWIPRAVHRDNRLYLQDRLAATRVNLTSNPL